MFRNTTATTTTTSATTLTMGVVAWEKMENFVFYFLYFPLLNLYLSGPQFKGYGFWQGRSEMKFVPN